MAGTSSKTEVFSGRLPTGMKQEWKAFCERQKEDPWRALVVLMRHLMKQPQLLAKTRAGQRSRFRATDDVDHSPKRRVELRLTESEYAALATIADESECSVQYWVVNLIRAALTRGVAVGVSELKELGKSNYQLMAIGRNLNQITHQINAEPGKHLPRLTAEKVEALADEIAQHRQRVQAVVDACAERWVLEAKE